MLKAKRILSLLLVFVLLFSVGGCGGTTVITSEIYIDESEDASTTESDGSSDTDTTTSSNTTSTASTDKTSSKDNSSKKPSSSSSKKPVSSKEENEKDEPGSLEIVQIPATPPKSFFGFYGSPGLVGSEVEDIEASDYVNCVIIGGWDVSQMELSVMTALRNKTFFWINIHFIEQTRRENEHGVIQLYPAANWKSKLHDIYDMIRRLGANNYFLGWYMDEPLLNRYRPEDVYDFTKYNHDTFGKRFFICFTVESIAPGQYSDGLTYGHMTKETSKYITDAGYDMYWNFKQYKSKYDAINIEMRTRLPDDCTIWYVPWTFLSNESYKFEDAVNMEMDMLDHLNGMYEYLKAEKNPGGIFCFTYRGDPYYFGIEEMVKAGKWSTLFNRCKEIGREICSKK